MIRLFADCRNNGFNLLLTNIMGIHYYKRTFCELRENVRLPFRDPHNIMSSLNEKMRDAVLNNPTVYDDSDVCQILALDGDVVVGCTNPFPGRLLINGDVVGTQNGSTLFSHEDYRKENVGGELFFMISKLHPTGNNFYTGISQMALPLYKVLKYTVFEFPRMIYLRKSRSVIEALLHSCSWWTKPLIWGADTCFWLHRRVVGLHNATCYRRYIVEEVKKCPDAVENIVLRDEHPYMEFHDKAWFDWSLNYSISEDERTKRRLYVVKSNEKVEAFFLIKQEFFKQASSRGFKNVYLGSVMEWGIDKSSNLEEKDVVLLSLNHFDGNIDGIQYATSDYTTARKLRRWLFVGIGMSNIGIRLRSIKDATIKDIDNWRIRLAGSDTVLN